jgi:hypothetical protein
MHIYKHCIHTNPILLTRSFSTTYTLHYISPHTSGILRFPGGILCLIMYKALWTAHCQCPLIRLHLNTVLLDPYIFLYSKDSPVRLVCFAQRISKPISRPKAGHPTFQPGKCSLNSYNLISFQSIALKLITSPSYIMNGSHTEEELMRALNAIENSTSY